MSLSGDPQGPRPRVRSDLLRFGELKGEGGHRDVGGEERGARWGKNMAGLGGHGCETGF